MENMCSNNSNFNENSHNGEPMQEIATVSHVVDDCIEFSCVDTHDSGVKSESYDADLCYNDSDFYDNSEPCL